MPNVQQGFDPRLGTARYLIFRRLDFLSFAYRWQRIAGQIERRHQHRGQIHLWRAWIDSGWLREVKQVLFLCYGNINRSVLAQCC